MDSQDNGEWTAKITENGQARIGMDGNLLAIRAFVCYTAVRKVKMFAEEQEKDGKLSCIYLQKLV